MNLLAVERAKKTAIEKRLKQQLENFYNDMLKDLQAKIINGTVYGLAPAPSYRLRLRDILQKHHQVVAELFVDNTMAKVDNLELIYADILNAVKESLAMRLDKEVNLISESSETRIKEWMFAVVLLLQSEEIESTPQNLSKAFRNLAKQRFATKSISESITQTNWAVEDAKRINSKQITSKIVENSEQTITQKKAGDEAWKISLASVYALASFSPRAVAPGYSVEIRELVGADEFEDAESLVLKFSQEKKSWKTVGDKNVRETHTGAEDLGEIGVDEFFQVGAYLMQYPGDTSMGAGIEEIINCRCDVIYI